MASATTSVYRTADAHRAVRRWCTDRLDRWPVPHRALNLPTSAGRTHVLVAGRESASREGRPAVVLVPGTNFNAATSLPLAGALAAHGPVYVVDVPGQPGLSAGGRPRSDRTLWYGRWLTEVLERAVGRRAVVVGHSLGGAVALACDSPHLAGRVLLCPAGLARLRITGRVLGATLPWLLRPGDDRSAGLLRVMCAPGRRPPAGLAAWLTLVARSCRTSLAPPPLPPHVLERSRRVPTVVAAGEHDVFLPPRRLVPAAVRRLAVEPQVLSGAGHLVTEEGPADVAALVEESMAGFVRRNADG